jgi:hypothetical protein
MTVTRENRVQAVESLGFTSRQARFVVTVALNGGYCMRRQYQQFSGLRYGKNVRDFLDGLVERRLARREQFLPNRGYVYHLHAKSLYRLLEQTDNRNRRGVSAALIARKLMLLDVVLTRPEGEWYATEDEKVALFTGRFNLPKEILPRRTFTTDRAGTSATTRHFVDKLPICVALEPPTVFFVFLPLDEATAAFQQFLIDHAELTAHLPSWRIVLATSAMCRPLTAHFSVFDRFRAGALLPPSAASVPDLVWYFRALDQVARNDVAAFSSADIDRFRRLRERFQGSRYKALYTDWSARGDEALQPLSGGPPLPEKFAGGLIVHELPSRYRQFGSLPGIA